MQIIFECPACMKRSSCVPDPLTGPVSCVHCGWTRDEGEADIKDTYVKRCRVCGCEDLWRQKDFPPGLGLAMVGCGIILSTIAWYNHYPELALGVLMAFALVDMLLYTFMADMLVCYRCRARHRRTPLDEKHGAFDLEVSERYVQMKKRQDSAEHSSKN